MSELFTAASALANGPMLGTHRRKVGALLLHFQRGGAHPAAVRRSAADGAVPRNAEAVCPAAWHRLPGLHAARAAAEERAGEEAEGA